MYVGTGINYKTNLHQQTLCRATDNYAANLDGKIAQCILLPLALNFQVGSGQECSLKKQIKIYMINWFINNRGRSFL